MLDPLDPLCKCCGLCQCEVLMGFLTMGMGHSSLTLSLSLHPPGVAWFSLDKMVVSSTTVTCYAVSG